MALATGMPLALSGTDSQWRVNGGMAWAAMAAVWQCPGQDQVAAVQFRTSMRSLPVAALGACACVCAATSRNFERGVVSC